MDNLAIIERNLSRAQASPQNEWNMGRVARLQQALADYKAYMAGTMARKDMCQTAKELTTDMPEWGTYGT